MKSANAIILCVWGGHSLSGGGAQCRQGDALLLVTLRHIPVLVSAAVLRSRRHHAPTHDVTRTHDVTTTHDVRRTSVVDDRSRHGLLRVATDRLRIVHLLIAVLVVAGLSRSFLLGLVVRHGVQAGGVRLGVASNKFCVSVVVRMDDNRLAGCVAVRARNVRIANLIPSAGLLDL